MCEVVSHFILCHLSPCTLLGDTCHVLVLYICRSESLLFVLVFASFNKHLYGLCRLAGGTDSRPTGKAPELVPEADGFPLMNIFTLWLPKYGTIDSSIDKYLWNFPNLARVALTLV